MRAGQTMRLSLRSDRCMSLTIFSPGTRSFGGFDRRCADYRLFTPTETGRYSLVVNALRGRDKQRTGCAWHRRAGTTRRPASSSATTRRCGGRVNGGIDSRDLYRFDVTRRSTPTLRVTGGPDLRLVTDKGRRLARGTDIERRVAGTLLRGSPGPGHVHVATCLPHHHGTVVGFNGRSMATVPPGSTTQLTVRVSPGVEGPARMILERFDPIDGWQFARTYRVVVRSGGAKVSFRPSGSVAIGSTASSSEHGSPPTLRTSARPVCVYKARCGTAALRCVPHRIAIGRTRTLQ